MNVVMLTNQSDKQLINISNRGRLYLILRSGKSKRIRIADCKCKDDMHCDCYTIERVKHLMMFGVIHTKRK